MMEAPKRKVTAKLSSHAINGHDTSTTSPSISPPPQLVVRAKISSTARARTGSSASAVSAPNSNTNGALRPQVHALARRSPSPAKMMRAPSPAKVLRAPSPTKFQSQPRVATVRMPTAKVAGLKPHVERTRQDSISSMLSLAPTASYSAPTSPLTRNDSNIYTSPDSTTSDTLISGSGSFRVKAKLSGAARPTPPSLSTILSPPSPASSSPHLPSPSASRGSRSRATTFTTRRPSVTFIQLPAAPPLEQAQYIPLPTSPPASTLSFSSRSSASASVSTSSAQSYSTNSGLTPPLPHTNHARSVSMDLHPLPTSPHDRPTSPSPKRTLVARVRPGTNVSGGRAHGWRSGPIEPGIGSRRTSLEKHSADESESSADEATRHPPESGVHLDTEDHPEDDVRAEAKSNRKIADLEITTRSLLTINAALEASKLRQAREIRELRRKLREARLAMPPGRFRLLSEEDRGTGVGMDADADGETDEDEGDGGEGDEGDASFKRVKKLMEDLLGAGRSALAIPASSILSANLQLAPGLPSPSVMSSSQDTVGLGLGLGLGSPRTGEVLGWDLGSSLGGEAGSGEGKDVGRGWKHGVAIGSRVLSAEEARLWVGDGEGKEGERDEEGRKDCASGEETKGRQVEETESVATDDDDGSHDVDGIDDALP
ncbi:hypothetical protein K439DRAFT_1659329 [Ramaria rubella]|nr:hypothetical protein K439DRAFT_1659329 [Ramaria rubella]